MFFLAWLEEQERKLTRYLMKRVLLLMLTRDCTLCQIVTACANTRFHIKTRVTISSTLNIF